MLTIKKRYEGAIRRHRRQIDPNLGGLGDVGDLGIPAVDAVIAQTQTKLDALVFAVQAGAALSAVGAVTGLILLMKGRR